jgi:hypothetical protein
MKVRIFHHGRCFDGCCSAAVFQRFYRECFDQSADFIFTPLLHQSGAIFDDRQCDGDENIIVDFKYSSSPAITWWFDHHLSAFRSQEDRAHFLRHQERRFYNPNAKSCAGWIATVAARDFGFNISPLQEMLTWADVVDSAKYDSPAAAVDLRSPAVKIALAIEAMPDEYFSQNIISMLAYESLEQIVESPLVRSVLPTLMAQHESSFHTLRKRIECRDRVVYFDLLDEEISVYNRFIPYYFHPDAAYLVGISSAPTGIKVAVGTNPWKSAPDSEMTNLAEICEAYGGGGHARVGGIAFPATCAEEARKAASEIAAKLRAVTKLRST